ncbi:MAG: twin-arginine translocase TatA/TatE family subunit [Alphaproteobacteria bacterium]|nr:twin-arginine translocase TatA/TatE family subunit [Alphaproteobacteria bacterium]
MLNLGFGEIALIMVLALVVVGPERLPYMIRYLGRQYGKLMRASDELRRAFVLEADRMDAEQRTEELRKRREQARKRAEELRAAREAGEPEPEGGPTLPPDAAVRPAPPPEPADAGDAAAQALDAAGIEQAPPPKTGEPT